MDTRDTYKPGFKFAEYEARGIPLRIAIGPRDVQNNKVEWARRDTLSKEITEREGLGARAAELLNTIQVDLYNKALARREEMTSEVETYKEFKEVLEQKGGWFMRIGMAPRKPKELIKNETKATIRCIPLTETTQGSMVTGKASNQKVLFAIAY